MSQSSGKVTHVLLTRSRLCPRPKPGSSLHLHVLGTPPAFVLSQDQTLREELLRLTKSRQGDARSPGMVLEAHSRSRANPGPVPGGVRPLRPHQGARGTRRAPGRKTGSILAPSSEGPAKRIVGATASNLDTPLDRRVDRDVRMLLSFQRPSHLFGRGFLSQGTAGTLSGLGADS